MQREDVGANVNEWVNVVRRARLGRCAHSVALTLASYADPNGTKVFPGVARLAVESEYGYPAIRKALAILRNAGLLELVRRGNRRRGHADEYRLIIAPDLLERVTVPNPEELRAMAAELASDYRYGKGRNAVITDTPDPDLPIPQDPPPSIGSTLPVENPPCRSASEGESPHAREGHEQPRRSPLMEVESPPLCATCDAYLDPDGSCFVCAQRRTA